MDSFNTNLADLSSLQSSATDVNELLLDVANEWQQISPESLTTALGMFGPQFLHAYRQAQQSYVHATTSMASAARTINHVTGRAASTFASTDQSTASALEAQQ